MASEPAYMEVKEGQAVIRWSKGNEVFYNNVQTFNRDMSVLAIKQFAELRAEERAATASEKPRKGRSKKGKEAADGTEGAEVAPQPEGISILEALSATGLRAIRYFKEIPGVRKIVVNDLKPEAVEAIRDNVVLNGLDPTVVVPNCGDANLVMYNHAMHPESPEFFDVVDLDPYGTAAIFLDAATRAVADGGLLCVTCTDMAVLSGNHADACWAKYNCMPLHTKFCHEQALRILLGTIDKHANMHRRYIVPLVALSIDFYIRVFVRVFTSPTEVKKSASKLSYVFSCGGCETFHLQPVGRVDISGGGTKEKYMPPQGPPMAQHCTECGNRFRLGGPFWNGALHDSLFVDRMLTHLEENKEAFATHQRMHGMLSVVAEELPTMLYTDLPQLCRVVHVSQPTMMQFRSAILSAGYDVSYSHCNPQAVKTTAPQSVLWDIIRCWVKDHPVKRREKTPGFNILAKEPQIEADFTIREDANPSSRRRGEARFPVNPEKYWGPKTRATGTKRTSSQAENPTDIIVAKRARNQGKHARRTVCKDFAEGTCKFGDSCSYYHPAADAAAPADEDEPAAVAEEAVEAVDERAMETEATGR